VYEQLWAPWRLGYVAGNAEPPKPAVRDAQWRDGADRDCFLCRAVAEHADRENLVVQRTKATLTVLNRYPYNNGHLLLAPHRHEGTLSGLTLDEQNELCSDLARWTDALARLIKAEGFNVGLNLGRVAGAGVPGHLHWHIVPRYSGDTNFLPVMEAVRVIPQSLDALWEILSTEAKQWE
jgi:ATP adenylyltransferase